MDEDIMNAFTDYLESMELINYTEVWECGPNNKLYGRTFTPNSKNNHRIEIYKSDEYSNEVILCHELAHVMLYKMNVSQDHGEQFYMMEERVHNLMKNFLKEENHV